MQVLGGGTGVGGVPVGVEVRVLVGGVPVGVLVGVGEPQLARLVISTVLISPKPLKPPTASKRGPDVVDDVVAVVVGCAGPTAPVPHQVDILGNDGAARAG